jgi:hypothetical protein
MPDSGFVFTRASNCDYQFEVGKTYLVFLDHGDKRMVDVSICSRTGLLKHCYFERYLLGPPSILYDSTITNVTLDSLLAVLRRPGVAADQIVSDFGEMEPEADLVLPTLIRIARGDIPGNRTAATRAIGELGEAAKDALDVLRRFDFPGGDATFRAARLETLMRVSGDFEDLEWEISRGIRDPSPAVRLVVLKQTPWLRRPYESRREIKKLMAPLLDDPHWDVRYAAIELFRWWEYSPDMVRKIRRMSRSDPDVNVRDFAKDYLEMKEERSRRAPMYRSVAARGFEHPSYRKQRK